MRPILNVWLMLWLSCVNPILIVAVYGSTAAPDQKRQSINIIVTVNEGSHNSEKAIKSLEATLEKNFQKLIRVINATSGENPNDGSNSSFASCKDIYLNHKSKGNGAYLLQMDSGKVPVFCHMTNLGPCGGGGWTLVMKIDGAKKTFHYSSNLWNNKIDYNFPGGKTGFDKQETKLPTYWNTPFSKICLGMKIGQQINFILINKQANSLYSLIADGQYHATSLGRNAWKTLIGSQASLQTNCNKEGFNAACSDNGSSRSRIGILGNNENECRSCDSRIGFGTAGTYGNQDDSNSCGNEAINHPSADNGEKHIKAMGYILVQ